MTTRNYQGASRRLQNDVGGLAHHGAISKLLPEGWSLHTAPSMPGIPIDRAARVTVSHREQPVMELTVDRGHVDSKALLRGLTIQHLERLVIMVEAAHAKYHRMVAEAAVSATASAELLSEIESLDAPGTRHRIRMAMAGSPEMVLQDAFAFGPGALESIKPWMSEGEIFVVKGTNSFDEPPVVESYSVLRDGDLVAITEAEVRQLAARSIEPGM